MTTFTLALPAARPHVLHPAASARGCPALGPAAVDLLRDLGVMALALVAYGALFALLGVLLKRPVIPGLCSSTAGSCSRTCPATCRASRSRPGCARSSTTGRPQEGLAGLFQQVLPAGQALAVLIGVSAVFLAAAAWIFSTREYVLEQ